MPPECTAPGRQDRFNPHPAKGPGDACPQIGNSSKDGGFNPHPANRPGDAIQRHLRSFPIAVSIRTRLTGRVMHGCGHIATVAPSFNPHPANRPGDARLIGDPQSGYTGFNPHPANRPGDAASSKG